MNEFIQDGSTHGTPFDDMMKLFDKLTFRQKWAKVRRGLKQPKTSGEHKWAVLQMQRLLSHVSAVVAPAVAMALMLALAGMAPEPTREMSVEIYDDEAPPELEEPEEIPEPEIQPPEPQEIVDPSLTDIPSTSETVVGPDVDFSPQPAEFDSVAIVRSPVTMRGIFSSRSPGARGSRLGRFGGSGRTEGAVLRALRWLKTHQAEDGSWSGVSGGGEGRSHIEPAMTALGLLSFLAHGETPQSPEFGETVQKAIRWMVNNQDSEGYWVRGRRRDIGYQHPIATFAMAEAYAMTQIPTLLPVVEKAIDIQISGQNPQGGWRYTMRPTDDSDASVMSWACQALKAADMAGISHPRLEEAMELAVKGWQGNFRGDSSRGFFHYTPGRTSTAPGLTGAGILSMQLLGAQNLDEVRGGLQYLADRRSSFEWDGARYQDLYYWYYDTQARFHEGGETWREWNEEFSIPLVEAQTIVPNTYETPDGDIVDIGYWCVGNTRGGRVMDTALSALQLMVYYRYLPTFQSPDQVVADQPQEEQGGAVEAQDLDITVDF